MRTQHDRTTRTAPPRLHGIPDTPRTDSSPSTQDPWAHFPQKGQTVQFPDPHPHAPDTTADMTAELEYEGVVSDITWTYRQRTPRTPPPSGPSSVSPTSGRYQRHHPMKHTTTATSPTQPNPVTPVGNWSRKTYGYSVLAGQYRIADMGRPPQDLPNGRIMAASTRPSRPSKTCSNSWPNSTPPPAPMTTTMRSSSTRSTTPTWP